MVRTRFVAIVASLGLLGAACTHSTAAHHTSAPPQPLTSASPSPTLSGPLSTGPGVLPGEKPPVLSADAKQHTPTGALLFAAYYIKALDWSVATNDAYLLREIAAPSCTACQRDISAVAVLRDQGAYEKGGRIAIVSSKLVTGDFKVKADFVVEVVTSDGAIVIVRPSAAPSTAAPAVAHDDSLVFVSWVRAGWRVVEEGAPS